jgi:hypothetical protein
MALKELVFPQSAICGWSDLVMDPIMYTLIKPTMTFVLVANLGDFSMYNNFTTKAAMKMTNKGFQHDKNYYPSFVNINRACFCMLNNNIADHSRFPTLPT